MRRTVECSRFSFDYRSMSSAFVSEKILYPNKLLVRAASRGDTTSAFEHFWLSCAWWSYHLPIWNLSGSWCGGDDDPDEWPWDKRQDLRQGWLLSAWQCNKNFKDSFVSLQFSWKKMKSKWRTAFRRELNSDSECLVPSRTLYKQQNRKRKIRRMPQHTAQLGISHC